MAYQGNNIGTSKLKGILDLYVGNVAGSPYAGQGGSRYSLQPGNGALGGANIVGGYVNDVDDGIYNGNHSGKFYYEYQGRTWGHNDMEVFTRIGEKPEPPVYFG